MNGQYVSPFGMITFTVEDGFLVGMAFSDETVQLSDHPVIKKIHSALDLYFKHQSQTFDIDLKFMRGTPFQKEVWERLLAIPYGQTKSYLDIAREINNEKAVRAVGQACKRNPIGIIVPCHRVIGKDGSMTGYSGKDYVDLKKKLLIHEQGLHHE